MVLGCAVVLSTLLGLSSSTSAAGTALAQPTAIQAGANTVDVSFTGDAIASLYTVTAYDAASNTASGQTCTVGNGTTSATGPYPSCLITDLTIGDSYYFTVTPSGKGTPSATSPPFATVTIVSTTGGTSPQSPLSITTTTGPAFSGAGSLTLPLATSGGSVAGLEAHIPDYRSGTVSVVNTSTNAVAVADLL
jgi:hypothetical protein